MLLCFCAALNTWQRVISEVSDEDAVTSPSGLCRCLSAGSVFAASAFCFKATLTSLCSI